MILTETLEVIASPEEFRAAARDVLLRLKDYTPSISGRNCPVRGGGVGPFTIDRSRETACVTMSRWAVSCCAVVALSCALAAVLCEICSN